MPVALLVCAGCQLLSVADVETSTETSAVDTAELEELLVAGQWEADREWSVLKQTSGVTAMPYETSETIEETE